MEPSSQKLPSEHVYDYNLAFPEGNPPTRERTDSASAMNPKLQDMLDRIMAKAA